MQVLLFGYIDSPIMAKVFDRARARDKYEKIWMLFGFQVLGMWACIGAGIYLSEGRSLYWVPSIVTSLMLVGHVALSFYLYRNVLDLDHNVDSQEAFINKMLLQDILSIVTASVCICAGGLAGWLGFTYGENPLENTDYLDTENKTLKQLRAEAEHREKNGKVSWALLGLNAMSIMMAIMCIWVDCKFRQYLNNQRKMYSETMTMKEADS